MQDEMGRFMEGMATRRPTPTAATMLAAVLLAVAAEVGRASLPAPVQDDLAGLVRERLAGGSR